VVVRELARRHSNWRSRRATSTPAAAPRRARHRRRRHPPPHPPHPRRRRHARRVRHRDGGPDEDEALGGGRAPSPAPTASTWSPGHHREPLHRRPPRTRPLRVVAYDFGIKTTILRHLGRLATVEVVPASTPAAEVLAREPDGVFLSNGPGDPATVGGYAVDTIASCSARCRCSASASATSCSPAIGGETVKLPFGHHGGNHPVRDLRTGTVEITSQNHNFAVDEDTLAGRAEVTHVNLNDGVCEGIRCETCPPSACSTTPRPAPAPTTPAYLFDRLRDSWTEGRA
jgi:carbamoyl-phosphate synthase small subunit